MFGQDPYLHDPQRWGVSLAQLAELLIPSLDAAGARTVVELGAYAGDLTRVLAAWAEQSGARIQAIDPAPQDELVELARNCPALELIRSRSLDALRVIAPADVVIVDGDHNYHTLAEELRAIAERSGGDRLPLLLFHDVCWPHGRRDDYYDPEAIPVSARHPTIGDAGGIFPGDHGIRQGALPYPRSATREGGPRNGVLTALEDFVAGDESLRLAVIPAFFGFGALWRRDAPWDRSISELLASWDRHPILERLEANRIHHLAHRHVCETELSELRERQSRQEALLSRMLESSAFAVADRLSRLRVRAGIARNQSAVSKEQVRRALGQ